MTQGTVATQDTGMAQGSEPEWLSAEEAMAYLSIARRTLYAYARRYRIRRGIIPAGHRIVFWRPDLDALRDPRHRADGGGAPGSSCAPVTREVRTRSA
jgi:hypothetical protein